MVNGTFDATAAGRHLARGHAGVVRSGRHRRCARTTASSRSRSRWASPSATPTCSRASASALSSRGSAPSASTATTSRSTTRCAASCSMVPRPGTPDPSRLQPCRRSTRLLQPRRRPRRRSTSARAATTACRPTTPCGSRTACRAEPTFEDVTGEPGEAAVEPDRTTRRSSTSSAFATRAADPVPLGTSERGGGDGRAADDARLAAARDLRRRREASTRSSGCWPSRTCRGAEFGELQLAMWKRQFERLRDGDRFFYVNDPALRRDPAPLRHHVPAHAGRADPARRRRARPRRRLPAARGAVARRFPASRIQRLGRAGRQERDGSASAPSSSWSTSSWRRRPVPRCRRLPTSSTSSARAAGRRRRAEAPRLVQRAGGCGRPKPSRRATPAPLTAWPPGSRPRSGRRRGDRARPP